MFNVTTGVILKIDVYFPNHNIIILTDNSGIKVVSLSKFKQYLPNYRILDMWTFIVINNTEDEVWIPYEQLSGFKQLQNNHDNLKIIYYFNKIVINSEPKYHNSTTLYFLLNCYQELILNSNNLEKMYGFLLFHTLSLQGIQFNFKNCFICGTNKSIVDFNPQLGGVLCYFCFDSSRLTTNNLSLFSALMKVDSINSWQITQKELSYMINILECHCQTYSGFPTINVKNTYKQLTK